MDRLTFDGTRVTVFAFTGDDRTDTRTYWKGTGGNDTVAATGYTFDAFGRLTRVRARDASQTTIVDFQRAYDYNGNPLYTEYGHKTTRSELYGTQTGQNPEGPADALNRLTRYRRGTLDGNKTDLSATVFAQDWHDTQGVLKLDKLGNWDLVRTDTTGGGTFTTETKGHNLANEYTSKNGQSYFDHDDDGNLLDDGTLTFSYDYANHLVKAVRKSDSEGIGLYTYDALGRRVKKAVDNTDTWDATTLFYYDGLRVLEKGALDDNAAYVASHQFVWGLYLDELLVCDCDADGDGDFDQIDQENGDKRSYALQDFIYSTHAVINSSGTVLERYDYQPYGAPSAWSPDYTAPRSLTTDSCPFLFTGQMFDPETGLYHCKRRAYHPTFGRFLQRDALPYIDGMSFYHYVESAPHRGTDPSGLCEPGRRTWNDCCPAFLDCLQEACRLLFDAGIVLVDLGQKLDTIAGATDLAYRAYKAANESNASRSLWAMLWAEGQGALPISAASVAALSTREISGILSHSVIVRKGVQGFKALTAAQKAFAHRAHQFGIYGAIAQWAIGVGLDALKVYAVSKVTDALGEAYVSQMNLLRTVSAHHQEVDQRFAEASGAYEAFDGRIWDMEQDPPLCERNITVCNENLPLLRQWAGQMSSFAQGALALTTRFDQELVSLLKP